MSFLYDLAFFALLFFVLVFVHELGHFLMARLVGIRVERFSIGMGPSLFSKKIGDTEYRLAALPLGGYVKMSGDEPGKEYTPEEAKHGFLTKTPPQKLLVVFGGPVFNLILPLLIFTALMMMGAPSLESRIGTVEPGGPADLAGLQSGDLITAVNGQSIQEWMQLEDVIQTQAGQNVKLSVERRNLQTGDIENVEISLTPEERDGLSRFGEPVRVGMIGISPRYLVPRLAFESEESPIAQAGAQPLDRVLTVDGVSIQSLDQLREALALRRDQDQINLTVQSPDSQVERELRVDLPQSEASVSERMGLVPVELVVGFVAEKVNAPELKPEFGVCQDNTSPAMVAGLQAGDRLVRFGDSELRVWEDLQEAVKASKGEMREIFWSRNGEMMSSPITPLRTTIFDPIRGRDNPASVNEVYRVGVGPQIESETSFYEVQSWNPIDWISYSVSETYSMVSLTGQAIWKLVTGDLSIKALGSPIMIFNVAGNSYRLAGGGSDGWLAFLRTLALLSITLGLVNLLPIPVLDGGHAVFFSLEWLRGKPLSLRALEIASQIGLVLLLGIFAVVLYNDFYRYDLVGGAWNNLIRFTNAIFFGCA